MLWKEVAMEKYLLDMLTRALALGDADPDEIDKELSAIVGRYSERRRHYHNLQHVIQLLGLCSELEIEDPDIVLAAIYHDIIYKPGSSRNEEKSADYARKSLVRLDVDLDRVERVCEMILATSNHLAPQDHPEKQTFLDLDLSILGSSLEDYRAYSKGVRKEHPWLPGFLFRKKRRQFLEKVLAEECIFHTDLFREKFEDSARANIEWELGLK